MATKAHLLAACPRMPKSGRDIVTGHAFSYAFSTAIQQDRTLLAAIWGRRRQTACHGCQSPLFHIGFDEDEAHLSKIDMYLTGPVGANSGKEILRFETVCYIIQLLSIACKENGACSRSIADANYVTLYICRTVGCRCKRLVVPTRPV